MIGLEQYGKSDIMDALKHPELRIWILVQNSIQVFVYCYQLNDETKLNEEL